ncbi:MAG: sodium/solute symporter [Sedimentisphaerales bacterium]|jgi:SSS family solute:Na+ symporter|nr:sodium/solute symporter [Sedimentisphaerales bacterium]HNY78989.1 sodium/solute symporter [Sedimentisphaerales bacterium]HOC64062.1 sodium/solute symporter [Sedimentisphaerales bacterium]HOH64903.1 sodium/solute symporter [Sedimentisphaerales bacterium]HPY50769.1 sodium/solute symporter [Sedimentisphaerales bacterium]
MVGNLGAFDIAILAAYCVVVVGMGVYYTRKCRTAEEFMVAGRSIPAWAAGLAIMSTYTSSISYIATPGKAYDTNWHPFIFSLAIFPVAWLACRYAVPYYRKMKLLSVYEFLEERIGAWGRVYAALSFLLYIVGRTAVILYLVGLLLNQFLNWPIELIIVVVGVVTILYTLLGGMEAVIWTDVMQSVIMIGGLVFCVVSLSWRVCTGPEPLIQAAVDAHKFSLGSWDLSLSSRTIWVMIIYGVTENLRNLLADQNFVQKYSSVSTEQQARRSIWIAMLIYIPMTAVFLYIGTALFAFYSTGQAGSAVTKGDEAFPYFIATQLPVGLKGLVLAAIMAAAMSTVDSGLNCSATVLLVDFYKRYFNPQVSDRASLMCLRVTTVVWGLLGTGFAILMIRAKSALDIWWQVSGIFGGGILGLFLLSLWRVRLTLWQGLVAVGVSIAVITWGTFVRPGAPGPDWPSWIQATFEPILVGAVGTAALIAVALAFHLLNARKS